MKALPDIRSHNNHNANKNLTNGDSESPSSKLPDVAVNGDVERPLIVTRSKTGKVLRSGRKTGLVLRSPSNGTLKSYDEKRCSSNGISPSLKNGGNVSAYAKHYKSYRRNSHSCRRLSHISSNSSKCNSSSSKCNPGRLRKRPVRDDKGRYERKTRESLLTNGDGPVNDPVESSFREKGYGGGKSGRRSALWVLNCEAEEFLFGETAATKQEVEPSVSRKNSGSNNGSCCSEGEQPPPQKRRRWRETELSHLLETTPFVESKLRSSSSPKASPDSKKATPEKSKASSLDHDDSRIKCKRKGSPYKGDKNGKTTKRPRKGEASKAPKDDDNNDFDDYSLHYCELLSPRSVVDKAALIQETLDQVHWNFSFEMPPTEETWYSTFARGEDVSCVLPYKSFNFPLSQPILLPYQLDRSLLLKRPRKKFSKNPRKSPRCHASTLAILSSSDEPQAPGSPSSQSPTKAGTLAAVSVAEKPAEVPVHIDTAGPSSPKPPPLLSPFTKFVTENSVRSTRRRNPSTQQDPYQLYQRTQGKRSPAASSSQGHDDLQYLWDSVQFLSDPYVVSILAGEDPLAHSNKCNGSWIASRTRHASSKSLKVLTPKSSPAKSTNNNIVLINGCNKNGIVPPAKSPNRSGGGGKGVTMSPIVVIADIFRSHSQKSQADGNCSEDGEEALFLVGETLPSLPLW